VTRAHAPRQVHERDLHSDFLLTVLREQLLPADHALKLVLMSATVDVGMNMIGNLL
jgi:HrpA-like RNA helicase